MSEVKYSKEHEWIKIEGDVGTVGITQHATEMLGDIVFVELPDVGSSVEKDGNAGVVESTKAASDVYTPISGEVMENGSKLIGLGARDTLRLEAGLCLYGHELDINKTPVEANLKWAISKERVENGGFLGSDRIKKQINDGVKKVRVGIKPEGRIIAREKTKIFNTEETLIGEITSGTFGPSVNGPVAMGYIDDKFSKKDTKILLEVRGKKYPANICGLPFYKKSYVKGATQ